jgi:hypothetical protein
MALEIAKEPYLRQLRAEVAELKKLVDAEPDDAIIGRAWASFDKIKKSLGSLCPNHPQIMAHR